MEPQLAWREGKWVQVYFARRALQMIPALFVVATIIFIAFSVVPGDPARLFAGEDAPQEYVERLRRDFGLHLPVHVRYVEFLKGLASFNLGSSYFSARPVWEEIIPRWRNSIELALVSFSLATSVGLGVGILGGAFHGRILDRVLTLLVIVGISIPGFWLALLLLFTFGVHLQWLPFVGKDSLLSYVLPAVSMSTFAAAFIARMTRSFILEELFQDYVRTANAKGLAEPVVLFKHVVRNALIPVITVLGLRFGYLLAGSVIVETIFAWPGIGYLFVTAVEQRDYPMIRGIVLVFAFQFMMVNLLVDLLYGGIDPRVRYDG